MSESGFYRRLLRAGCLVWVVLLLGGCAGNAVDTSALDPYPVQLGEGGPSFDTPRLVGIDDPMRTFLDNHVGSVRNPIARLETLLEYIHNKAYLGVRYNADSNTDARAAFRTREANCLSFSALVISLARELGLDARFQYVPMLPSWRRSGNTYLVEQHVNVAVGIGARHYVIDFEPPDNLSSRTPRLLTDDEADAMLLGNLGVSALARDDLVSAYGYFRQGLLLDPGSPALWVNFGVALSRAGEPVLAERAYGQTLSIEPGNLSALNNLLILRKQQGADDPALEQRLRKYRRSNPYYLYWLAERRLTEGRPELARQLLEEALQIRSDEVDFYLLLAEALVTVGDTEGARQQVQNARSQTTSASQQARIDKRLSELDQS